MPYEMPLQAPEMLPETRFYVNAFFSLSHEIGLAGEQPLTTLEIYAGYLMFEPPDKQLFLRLMRQADHLYLNRPKK